MGTQIYTVALSERMKRCYRLNRRTSQFHGTKPLESWSLPHYVNSLSCTITFFSSLRKKFRSVHSCITWFSFSPDSHCSILLSVSKDAAGGCFWAPCRFHAAFLQRPQEAAGRRSTRLCKHDPGCEFVCWEFITPLDTTSALFLSA